MKKTITLLAIAALVTTASFAQNHPRDNDYGNNNGREMAVNNDRDGYGRGRERGTYYFTAREKDMQIYSINNEYNRKIESVKHKFFMGRSRKEQIICSLELQRDAEIRSVVARFNDRRNSFDRRDNWSHDGYKKGNW